ncbi:hypothetical protein [Bradyrhizobium genosp. A]|uniref:hypothetical protein n=1 Tax=Bradyrhizobium genosp. A TaxID=83626 RepID=UPI003CED222A
MSQYSPGERTMKAVFGLAILIGWFAFVPDDSALFHTPLGQLSLAELLPPLLWLVALVPCTYAAISSLYEAIAGRDRVWLWHPD